MGANMSKTYYFKFWFFGGDINKRKIVENHKTCVWMVENVIF